MVSWNCLSITGMLIPAMKMMKSYCGKCFALIRKEKINMGIDISELVKAAENPQQAQSIMGWLKELNSILGEANKTLSFAKSIGISPEVMEKLIIQWRGLDKVPSLEKNGLAVVPASTTHKAVFEQLNALSDADLIALSKKIQEQQKVEK